MAASFNCCVVTLLVWSRRRTSLAASCTVGSKVVTHCWMSVCPAVRDVVLQLLEQAEKVGAQRK